jgi:hydrogenase expression/formation protein HypE
MSSDPTFAPGCPLPAAGYALTVMAHGGGGRLMQQLLDRLIRPALDNPWLAQRHDAAVIECGGVRLAFTTDAYVVKPLFFPGGDIGKLAACGTLNDLAVAGARPLFLSAALVIEEGFPLADLKTVLTSLNAAARAAGTAVVTGDTKVVERGKGDGLYIATSGIGVIDHPQRIGPRAIRADDAVLVSGDLGRHGVAVLAAREGLGFETTVQSDCADLSALVMDLIAAGHELHCLRDLTRGGLAAALVELARDAGVDIEVDDAAIPVAPGVRAASGILGLDPLHLANEGRMVLFVPPAQADATLARLRGHPLGREAARIGVVRGGRGGVRSRSAYGTFRVIDLPSGEQLPRIC